MKKFISASILSSDFAKLGEEINNVFSAGVDFIHLDIMDNHYVPNLTIGPIVCQHIHKNYPHIPLDVHIMAKPVDRLIDEFARAGASIITIHPDSTTHLDRTIQKIHDAGCKAGIAINPATTLDVLEYTINQIDWLLIMTVNPGFGGQKFISSVLKKIESARHIIDKNNKNVQLSVDGGITLDNIQSVKNAGANVFVVGNTIFSTDDYQKIVTDLHKKLTP